MEAKDWIMTIAVMVSPLVALQVQKWIESWKEKRQRKLWIYMTLMTTRHATLSFDHVRALNMIDLEFYGCSEKEKAVRTAWKSYLDHLDSAPKGDDPTANALWSGKTTEFFANLLKVMGDCVGYDFDPVHIKKGIYAPKGHVDDEVEQRASRRLLFALLAGDRALKIHASLVPANEAAAKEGKDLLEAIKGVYEGKQAIRVSVENDGSGSGIVR